MKKIKFVAALLCMLLLSAGCIHSEPAGKISSVGMLVPESVSDQVWGTLGYKGLLNIQSDFGVNVYYKESVLNKQAAARSIEEFERKGVNLVFGNGNHFVDYFNELAPDYPNIHFVSFNGHATEKNTTSMSFEGHAMGFFGGMTAAHMSRSKTIAVIAAYDWQPEIKGFIEGAKYEDPEVNVIVQYTEDWDNAGKALEKLDAVTGDGADVVYPAGDGFNVPIIESIKTMGLFAIGYVSDQSDLGESTVLTSTVQHLDKLYEIAAERYAEGKLSSGDLSFGMKEGAITMGKFSPVVDKAFQVKAEKLINEYKRTGKLPD